jgi:A/G-specific adenine glycosylase
MLLDDQISLRAPFLRRRLLLWYRANARDLPWRRTRDPYRIWLSEVLLQQTRVETVLPYYARFIAAFPTVRELAAAREDRVLKLWEGLGYYTRARNLLRAAKAIVGGYGGRFPRTAREWQRLPGVGRYTANAIASIAFGESVPVLDGNVKRVLARLFNIGRNIAEAWTQRLLWSVAERLVPPRVPGEFNQAMMELGARVCTPRAPRCVTCPIRGGCEARALGRQSRLPVRRAKRPLPHHQIVAAAIEKNGRFLLGKRPPDGLLGGLWEFPGGKVEAGESHTQALVREIREELGIEIAVGAHLASVVHTFSHFRITLHVYRCKHVGRAPRPRHHSEIKWVRRAEFDRYAFPAADRRILPLL